jgi:replicative DNA helicase
MAICSETRVLLFDGSIKKASELVETDLLMGDDSNPREILSLNKVITKGVKIIPNSGQPLNVSPDQLITLKKSKYLERPYKVIIAGKIKYKIKYRIIPNLISLKASELGRLSQTFKRSFLLTKTAVNYPTQSVAIDPYFLGLWLGDGNAHNIGITSLDAEIIDYVNLQSKKFGLKVNINRTVNRKVSTYTITRGNVGGFGRKKNPLILLFQYEGLLNNKHIPKKYLANTYEVRRQLLAGIIDTDGYMARNVIYITQKSKQLINDIYQLASSLGFRCTLNKTTKGIKSINFKGVYYNLILTGDLNSIPTLIKRKQTAITCNKYDRKQTGYKLNSIEEREMIHLVVNENGRFLRDDCTIIGGTISHFE